MRFLSLYRHARPEGVPPSEREMAEMGRLIDEMTRAGVLLATEGCMPSAQGARVRLVQGAFAVNDGPFADVGAAIGGFALIQARSREEAIEWSKRFLRVVGDGECEIRQLYDAPDCMG